MTAGTTGAGRTPQPGPGSEPGAPSEPGPGSEAQAPVSARGRREITDPRIMRALAHPMRLALLDLLDREGPLTATRAAELLDDSPGNMSWHLQTLAKYGFVEEAGGGRGRSRPWRLVDLTYSFTSGTGDAEQLAAGEALETSLMQRRLENLRAWWSFRRGYPQRWREAAFSNHSALYLTFDELDQLGQAHVELLAPFIRRSADKSLRPPDALPVDVVSFGHPVGPAPSGPS